MPGDSSVAQCTVICGRSLGMPAERAMCDRTTSDHIGFLPDLAVCSPSRPIGQSVDSDTVAGDGHRRGTVLSGIDTMFRSIVEHFPDGVAIVGSDGYLIYANQATERILGVDPVDATGLSIFSSLHPRDRLPAVELFREVLAPPGSAVTTELRFRHVDNGWIPLAVTAVNCVDCLDIAAILVCYRAL